MLYHRFQTNFQGRKHASASAKDKVITKGDDNQQSASRTDNTVSSNERIWENSRKNIRHSKAFYCFIRFIDVKLYHILKI